MIHKYVRTCKKCQIMNLQKPHYINFHKDITQTPQDHLSIDLMGPYNTTIQGITYTLTTICNLTGYLMTTPTPAKKISTAAIHLFADIMLKFRFPRIFHADNGTELKSKLPEHLPPQLGIKKTYISPCHPQLNGKRESSHQFCKDCICKFSMNSIFKWDQLLPYAKLHSTGSQMNIPGNPPFSVFWMRLLLTTHATFLQPTLRYLGMNKGMTHLHKL